MVVPRVPPTAKYRNYSLQPPLHPAPSSRTDAQDLKTEKLQIHGIRFRV